MSRFTIRKDRRTKERRACACDVNVNVLTTVVFLIAFAWVGLVYLIIDGHSERAKLQQRATILEELQKDQSKGKRNTYCDHVRHLVVYHDLDLKMLVECTDLPITDLQILLDPSIKPQE